MTWRTNLQTTLRCEITDKRQQKNRFKGHFTQILRKIVDEVVNVIDSLSPPPLLLAANRRFMPAHTANEPKHSDSQGNSLQKSQTSQNPYNN